MPGLLNMSILSPQSVQLCFKAALVRWSESNCQLAWQADNSLRTQLLARTVALVRLGPEGQSGKFITTETRLLHNTDTRTHRKASIKSDKFPAWTIWFDCLQWGILDPLRVVNVCFRQLVLKNSDYSGKLSFFGSNSCSVT